MVQYGIDGGRHVVQYARDVRHDLVDLQHDWRLLLHPVDSEEALCMERRPTDEKGDDNSHCNHNNTLSLTDL